ncbi:MAG: hypothetical protein SGJ05_09135 [bacterium]|nr:hypothetical protein [bacterium]
MNIKRVFGVILTVLGIGALLYTGFLGMNTGGQQHDIRAIVIYGVLGLIFFLSGMGLVRAVKDEA